MEKEPIQEITIVDNPIPSGCPACWNMITKARMEDEYLVYQCSYCGWVSPKTDFYKIGKAGMQNGKVSSRVSDTDSDRISVDGI